MNRAGAQPSRRAGRLAWLAIPGSIASAQPTVGSRPRRPGTACSCRSPARWPRSGPGRASRRPSPPALGSRASRPAPTARSAPIPSSQARVGSEKNAHGSLALVSHSDSANERGGHDRGEQADPSQPQRPDAGHAARGEQEQRRPEEVELLLDAERPEVEERRRRELRLQVVGRLEREPQVRTCTARRRSRPWPPRRPAAARGRRSTRRPWPGSAAWPPAGAGEPAGRRSRPARSSRSRPARGRGGR